MDFDLGPDTPESNERIGRSFREVSNRLHALGLPSIKDTMDIFHQYYANGEGNDYETLDPFAVQSIWAIRDLVLRDPAKYASVRDAAFGPQAKGPDCDPNVAGSLLDAALSQMLTVAGFEPYKGEEGAAAPTEAVPAAPAEEAPAEAAAPGEGEAGPPAVKRAKTARE